MELKATKVAFLAQWGRRRHRRWWKKKAYGSARDVFGIQGLGCVSTTYLWIGAITRHAMDIVTLIRHSSHNCGFNADI